MLELINKGGPINWLIVLLYFVVVAIGLERAIYFYFTRLNYKVFAFKLFDCLSRGSGVDELLARHSVSPTVKSAAAYLKYQGVDPGLRDEILEKVGGEEIEKMENYLGALSVIGPSATLLGLLGTITGLIRVFHVVETLGGTVDVALLSGGIWEAMLTTAFGLSLAIPTTLLFSFFNHLVGQRVSQMNHIVSSLNVFFNKHG